MKSLAQRLKEKEAKEAKARLKRSDRIKSFSLKFPWCGFPSIVTEGDSLYIKKRAKRVVDLIQARVAWQFFQAMRDYIFEIEETRKKHDAEREARWAATATPIVVSMSSVAPATPPQPSPTVESVATTPPAQRLESPGVSVREIDNTTTAAQAREAIPAPLPVVPEITEEDLMAVIEECAEETES